ncbi:MAG: hypothetical protein ACRD0J_06345, partial [Acidimicrobiales bacterium]
MRLLVVAAVAGALAEVVVASAGKLTRVHLDLRPGWLVLAVPFSVASGLALALAWRRLLAAWGTTIGAGPAIRIWWRAQASRYLPTGAFAVASREVLAARAGAPRSLGASSNLVEIGVLVAWGTVVAGVLLPSSVLPLAARSLVAAAGVAALVALPWGLRMIIRLVPRRLADRLPALTTASLHPLELYQAAGLYGVSVVAKSGAFALFAAGVLAVHTGDTPLLMGAVQGASVVGILGVTPAGFGVREGVLAVVLGPRFGVADALALGVAWRAWELAFEL